MNGFPTSSDIYLEANGRKIAVVQSYKAVSSKSEKLIEAFGETEPIAALTGRTSYKISLTRLYATDFIAFRFTINIQVKRTVHR